MLKNPAKSDADYVCEIECQNSKQIKSVKMRTAPTGEKKEKSANTDVQSVCGFVKHGRNGARTLLLTKNTDKKGVLRLPHFTCTVAAPYIHWNFRMYFKKI